MENKTRKLISTYKAFYSRDDINRLYVTRKEGGRWLENIEDSMDGAIQELEEYKN